MIFFEDSDRIWENENPLLIKQGVFKVGGKKENKSDLFLLKSKKDHFYLILKNHVKQYN